VASPELTDPRSARVRRLRRLARRAFRAQERQFLVEGAQAVRESLVAAHDGGARVHEVLVTADAAARHPQLVELAGAAEVPVTLASASVLDVLSETVTPQGLVAVVDFLDVSIDVLIDRRPRLVAVLADVRDPGNAGSVIRAADAAGADAVIFAGDSVDPYNGKAVRASVGGLFHLPVVTGVSVDDALADLRSAGLAILVAEGSGSIDLDATDILDQRTAWVFGNEAWGVPADVAALADAAVRIPIYGRAESLNLATAATLCLYASARAQRSESGRA
jgi:TrmH family RNA methyltransferase